MLLLFLAFVIFLLSALVASMSPPPGSPDRYEDKGAKYVWGQRKPNDRDIYYRSVIEEKKTWRKVRRKLELSKKLYPLSTITCIEVVDCSLQGDRGTVTVTKGGVNCTYITLNFESIRGKGLNFNVTLYSDEREY